MKFLRLYRMYNVLKNQRFITLRCTDKAIDQNNQNDNNNKDFKTLLEEHRDKITFSSYLEHEKVELGYFKYHLKHLKLAKRENKVAFHKKHLPPLPVSLKYCVDSDQLLTDNEDIVNKESESESTFQLPFAKTTCVECDKNTIQLKDKSDLTNTETGTTHISKWMTNYEHFDDSLVQNQVNDLYDDDVNDWSKYYGTPDPNVRVSTVPCGGCGALLHCSDPAIPGYLPSEIYKGRKDTELKTIECQRCHFLKEYNVALDVSVQPEEYEKLLQSIRNVKSLVLLMVDLLDFPCSIWPDIVDIIGMNRPLIIVGNKVDLLPGDSYGYLNRIRESLLAEINKTKLGRANIRHVSLISAKTGYGVEELISTMFKMWLYKGDVFLVGCTNVGKSSLFNALLQSDYCKVHAVDIVKRATVSRWPGTTLNLLKFPINRPSGWKIHTRSKRLKSDAQLLKTEKELRRAQLAGKGTKAGPSLMGHIGRSFSVNYDGTDEPVYSKILVLDERHPLFANSKWFYDTPGVVHPQQVLPLLSTEELLLAIPKDMIKPQTFYLRKGFSVFIGGLARVDLVNCTEPCRLTVFCSSNLPITITRTDSADEVYDRFVGTELLAVPKGGARRLSGWPGLTRARQIFRFQGEGPKLCCGDIVLSSVAWVALTVKRGSECEVAAWTPESRGIHQRNPALLPYAVNLKGKRVRDTPAYMVGGVFAEED